MEIEDAWEEVAGKEQEAEGEEPHAEEEPEVEAGPELEDEVNAEHAQSPPATIFTNSKDTISNDIDYLFNPATRAEIRRVYGIQRESPVASKKPRATRGTNDKEGTTTTRASTKARGRRARKQGYNKIFNTRLNQKIIVTAKKTNP
jgi:hypothetical protein